MLQNDAEIVIKNRQDFLKQAKILEKLKNKEIAEKTANFMRMLAGSLAHEIKTPLAVIGINADLLEMDPYLAAAPGKEKVAISKYLKGIKHSIRMSTQIIDNILLMLKTLSIDEYPREKFEKLSIKDDLRNLLEIYPLLEHEKSLLKYDLNQKKDFFYCGDKVLTQHVLFNLVRNALHAIKEAEKGEISITFRSNPKYNILKFTDTALGIAKKDLPNIFDQFRSGKKDGAGLGLTFCKMVMRLYGGDITCRSKEGEYAEFTLMFPKKPVCKFK